jgi:four helix bundle protein
MMSVTTKQMKAAVVGKVEGAVDDGKIVKTADKTAVKSPKPTVKSFKDLGTWQLAQELAVATYRQCELFPQAISVLTWQLTQAATVACANIAESFSQRGEDKERTFNLAQNALSRLESHLLIAEGLGYLSQGQREDLCRRVSNTHWALLKLQKINREWMGK